MSLTDSEIIELERLLDEQEIFERRESLKDYYTDQNPNYTFLSEAIRDQKYDSSGKLIAGFRGVTLEGSSRAGKTFSGVDKIIDICLHLETACSINIYRETYTEFKDTLYDDFKKRLDYFGLHNPFHNAQEVKSFKIGRNKITFIGCDKVSKAHGAGSDYAFFNEIMHIPQAIFDQVEMRCRKFWWSDYNPSFTDHWYFDKVINRSDVGFLRTTFNDNRHISIPERNKVLSYEPWESGSYTIESGKVLYNGFIVDDNNQPPPNLDNINSGTADEFMWKVYGLGLRGSMKGQIYKYVKYIDKFPDIAFTYGLDLGFVQDPSALVKYAREGRNIYLELLLYAPTETAAIMDSALTALNISKYVPITCDSSDRYVSERKGVVQMVRELFDMGWEISKVSKTKGIMYWILDMKGYKIHVINNHLVHHFKKEQENYKFKEVNGILINQPIDGWDHGVTAARYSHMSHDLNNFTVERN